MSQTEQTDPRLEGRQTVEVDDASVTIYCSPCRTNHRLGQRDAEDAIQALIAELATEQAEGNVFTNPADGGTDSDLTDEMCVLRELPIWRDGEMFAEHLEDMAEARRIRSASEAPIDASGEPGPIEVAGVEDYCHRCGGRNPMWSAASPLWNEVMRGGDIDGPWRWDEIICPSCFAELAETAGTVSKGWHFTADHVDVPLTLVTPSGRVWDEGTQLWVDPTSVEAHEEPAVEVPTEPVGDLEREVSAATYVGAVPGNQDLTVPEVRSIAVALLAWCDDERAERSVLGAILGRLKGGESPRDEAPPLLREQGLRDAWSGIHPTRFGATAGTVGGPDSFYNGGSASDVRSHDHED